MRKRLVTLATFGLLLAGMALFPGPASRAAEETVSDEFFAEKLYPVMQAKQCPLCHNDNGIATASGLHFPPDDATRQQVTAFGLSLAELVDRNDPQQSILLRKPTNRTKHTGGERIPPGSEEEKLLLAWVNKLAGISDEKLSQAKEQGHGAPAKAEAPLIRRLTHSQYNNTVHDLLGDQTRPSNQFPPEDFIHGFRNQSEGQSVPPLLAEAYSQAAEKLARNAFRGGDTNHLIPCRPASAGDGACRARFVREFGSKAFRRPLTAAEAAKYEGLFEREARREGSFLTGAQIVVEAMLQSPAFLFLAEEGPKGSGYSYEMASRLSYFLWNTMPDEGLFEQAKAGKLATAAEIEKTARRMLDDPRTVRSMEDFLSQWLRFDRVLTTLRDRRLYRDFNAELAVAMTEETKRLFNYLVWENKNFMEFLTADYSFVSTDLAKLYGLEPPADEFGLVKFPADSVRAGVLGHGSILTLTSKPSDTSPTERGLFVREHFLCQTVPPPPPGVNTTLPPVTDEKPLTNRDRLAVHLTNPGCVSCHRLVDPIGFGFENFDAIGRFREKQTVRIFSISSDQDKSERKEHVLDLDTSAELAGIPNSAFSNPKELGRILAGSEVCQKCMVKLLYRYALGRPEGPADQAAVDRSLKAFEGSQFRFQELIISVVTSEPFLGKAS